MRKIGNICGALLRSQLMLIAATFLFSVLVLPVYSQDAGSAKYNWAHPNEVHVTPEEMAFTSADIGATKSESLYVWVYSPDGGIVLFCLFHVDAALVNKWGMFSFVVDPEGKTYWKTAFPRLRSVKYAEDKLSISAEGMALEQDADGAYRLRCDFDGLTCNIRLVERMPPWKPGTGRLNYTSDGLFFQQRALVVPWGYASGTVSVDGKPFSLDGHGYLGKTRYANPLTRFAPDLYAIKLYDDENFLYLVDATLNDAYNNRRVPMLVYAHNNRWVFTTQDYTLEMEKFSEVADVPYPRPTRIHIHHEEDSCVLDGVYEEEKLLNVTDVFGEFPAVIRKLAELMFSRPIYFRSRGNFDGTVTLKDGTVRPLHLSGPYEYTIVK